MERERWQDFLLEGTIGRVIKDFNSHNEEGKERSLMDVISDITQNSGIDPYKFSLYINHVMQPTEQEIRDACEHVESLADADEMSLVDITVGIAEHLIYQRIQSDFPEYVGQGQADLEVDL